MSEVGGQTQAMDAPRGLRMTALLTRARIRTALACAIVAFAGLVALSQIPGTLSKLSAQAKRNDAYGSVGRQLAAADSLDIDDGLVLASLDRIPADATFAVVPPTPAVARRRAINPVTIEALPGYFRWLLLPRTEVDPSSASYILCYGCDATSWRDSVHWLWSSGTGLELGRVEKGS